VPPSDASVHPSVNLTASGKRGVEEGEQGQSDTGWVGRESDLTTAVSDYVATINKLV
jgi:hypothetical protein